MPATLVMVQHTGRSTNGCIGAIGRGRTAQSLARA